VEYFGAPYAGWQWQEGAATVQGELERALKTALREEVRVTGAGRTDAGVHALGQVAHFDCEGPVDPERLVRSVNALAGPHICVRGLEPCPEEFHARYSAASRRYRYRIALRPVALLREISWHPGIRPDPDRFAAELSQARGKHDFLNFSIPREDGKSTECRLLATEVLCAGAFLEVRVEADRFLHKMVRSLVGACYDVARGAQAPGLVPAILAGTFQGERTWAPARGLCLEKVAYPDYDA
jgi:tRNA pseudouridine38-40 synthase